MGPTTARAWRWSTVGWVGLATGVGIAIGIGLGVRYLDLQRAWGCEGLGSHALGMLVTTFFFLLGVEVVAGLMLLSTYWRRVGLALLLVGSSTFLTLWLIAGNARLLGSPC